MNSAPGTRARASLEPARCRAARVRPRGDTRSSTPVPSTSCRQQRARRQRVGVDGNQRGQRRQIARGDEVQAGRPHDGAKCIGKALPAKMHGEDHSKPGHSVAVAVERHEIGLRARHRGRPDFS